MKLIDAEKVVHEYYKNPSYQQLCKVLNEAPTVKAIPLDKPFCKMVYGDYVVYNKKWLVNHLQTEWNILQGKEYKPAIPVELYEQVKGERDVAVEQLKSLNIELFEKPYLKAIPVEWILKWACGFINPNSEGYKMAMELVHDWEKENE